MTLDERVKQVEAHVGKRLIIRSVRTPEEGFRGRVQVGVRSVLIEYREDTPGYFWGYELLEELLDHVEQGRPSAIIYEGGIQYVPTSLAELEQAADTRGDDD
jgi:hypothetical protein